MNLYISKQDALASRHTRHESKNSESFYIAKSCVQANVSTTSTIDRKLGTLDKLLSEFLEKPSYELQDIIRALDVFGNECDLIQSEVYKNRNFITNRDNKVLYYDCPNFYFEIE